jgi:hypothetical protein
MKSLIHELLHSAIPSVQLRTRLEILQQDPSSNKISTLKEKVETSRQVQRLFATMHPDGYWLQKNPRSGVITGKNVEYGAYATTHFVLSYLSELGLDRKHPLVCKAAERYLNLLSEDGDWWNHMSCLYAYNIRTYVRFGYLGDTRLEKAISLLLNTDRFDGGYLCDMHANKRKTKNTKSCYRGAVKALLAFSELPQYWNHERCEKLVHYFLSRNGIYNSKRDDFVVKDVQVTSYPILWSANTYEVLLALSKMGYGAHQALKPAWKTLESKKHPTGKYMLDWTPAQSPFKVGKRNEVNDWISFYVALAYTYKTEKKRKRPPSNGSLLNL